MIESEAAQGIGEEGKLGTVWRRQGFDGEGQVRWRKKFGGRHGGNFYNVPSYAYTVTLRRPSASVSRLYYPCVLSLCLKP